MAVRTVTIWSVQPGRVPEFIALAAQAKAIHTRLGGSVRLGQITIGGPNTGQIVYSIEHADMTAMAKFTDKLNADAEWLKFFGAAQAGGAATLLSQSLATDIAI